MEHPARKLGLIVPSWNTVMENEVQRMAGGAMSVPSMRLPHTADTEEKLLWLGTQAPAAVAEALRAVDVGDAAPHGRQGGGSGRGAVIPRNLTV